MTHAMSWLLWTALALSGFATADASRATIEESAASADGKVEEKSAEKGSGKSTGKSIGKSTEKSTPKDSGKNGAPEKRAQEPSPKEASSGRAKSQPQDAGAPEKKPAPPKAGDRETKRSEAVVTPIRCGSAQELVDTVLAAIERGDRKSLNALRVDGKEYEAVLWPRFVEEHPELEKQRSDFHFFLLETKSRAGIQDLLSEFGRKKIELVRFQHERVEDYRTFKLWRNVTVDFKANGKLAQERLFGAIIERNGKFYLLSYPS